MGAGRSSLGRHLGVIFQKFVQTLQIVCPTKPSRDKRLWKARTTAERARACRLVTLTKGKKFINPTWIDSAEPTIFALHPVDCHWVRCSKEISGGRQDMSAQVQTKFYHTAITPDIFEGQAVFYFKLTARLKMSKLGLIIPLPSATIALKKLLSQGRIYLHHEKTSYADSMTWKRRDKQAA